MLIALEVYASRDTWSRLPKLGFLHLNILVNLQRPVLKEGRYVILVRRRYAHDLRLMQALRHRDLRHIIKIIPQKLIVCFQTAIAISLVIF